MARNFPHPFTPGRKEEWKDSNGTCLICYGSKDNRFHRGFEPDLSRIEESYQHASDEELEDFRKNLNADVNERASKNNDQCSSTVDGGKKRCKYPAGHKGMHTSKQVVEPGATTSSSWWDESADGFVENNPFFANDNSPNPFDKGQGGRFGHALFYRWKYRDARNRVIPKED